MPRKPAQKPGEPYIYRWETIDGKPIAIPQGIHQGSSAYRVWLKWQKDWRLPLPKTKPA